MIASLHHLLLVAGHMGLLGSHWVDWLLGPMAAIQATLAVFVAMLAVVLARHYWHRVGRAHTMVDVLTDRREEEMLDLIRKGVINDHEIAQALQIAPATAATHVQRILHKTRLHNRRELMLLPPQKAAA